MSWRSEPGWLRGVRTPVGPSMQMAWFLAGEFGEIPLRVLDAAWDAWVGPQRISRKVAQLEARGAVAATAPAEGVERIVRLTEAGRLLALGGRDPERCWQRGWDGRWRIVLFDVAEKHRARRIGLQRQLRRAHFGYLQDSVWITPDPVETLEAALRGGTHELASLSFLEARPCAGATDAELVAGAWDFTAIHLRYSQHAEFLRAAPSPQAHARAKREWCWQEWRAWLRVLQLDPLLPQALLPAGYRGRKAWEARRERLSRLFAGS